MTAQFIVRAQIVDASLREEFDRWYREEHLLDAHRAFGSRRAWRGWSEVDSLVHYAVYEFESLAQARAILESAALARLVVDFDRAWGDRVTRSREIMDLVQTIGG